MEVLQERLREVDPENALCNQNLSLVTLMAAKVEPEKTKNFGCFAVDEKTHEMLHYAENADI